jgi:outer membrane protein
MISFITSIAAAAGLSILCAGAASAQLPHNLQVRVGVSAVLPDESASISTIGGNVDISDEYAPSVQLEWFFSDSVSAELLCCMARHDVVAKGTALGDVNLGKISHFPPTLTVKYHFNTEGALQPYVGAGVNYTLFFDDEVPAGGPVTSIDYDPSFGGALQAGFDYKLDDHWSLNADIRKVWINSDVTIMAGATRIDADVDINPVIVTTGIGYRF